MNIYNKVTLSVILVITILISFIFYFLIKKINLIKMIYMKTRLLTVNQQPLMSKTYGVASNNAIATRVGNKIIEDGGNAVDAAEGVAYALAVTEPHSSGLGGGGATLTYDGKMVKNLACMNIKQHLHLITKREIK